MVPKMSKVHGDLGASKHEGLSDVRLFPLHHQQAQEYNRLVRSLRNRVAQDWDVCAPITGLEGTGKSTFALQLAYSLDPNFSTENIAWDVDQAVSVALRLPNGTPMVVDENFESAFNREAMSKANKKWVKFLGTARARNLVVLMCFPRFANLDPYIRTHRATHWFHIPRRGLALLRTQIDMGESDPVWKLRVAVKYGSAVHLPFWNEYQSLKHGYVNTQGKKSASKNSL
jgi:hypothetical protein